MVTACDYGYANVYCPFTPRVNKALYLVSCIWLQVVIIVTGCDYDSDFGYRL